MRKKRWHESCRRAVVIALVGLLGGCSLHLHYHAADGSQTETVIDVKPDTDGVILEVPNDGEKTEHP